MLKQHSKSRNYHVSLYVPLLPNHTLLPQTAWAEVRLAVLEFRGVGVSETLLQVLSDKVRSGVLHVSKGQQINGEDLIIMTRENMIAVLNDQGFSAEDAVVKQ